MIFRRTVQDDLGRATCPVGGRDAGMPDVPGRCHGLDAGPDVPGAGRPIAVTRDHRGRPIERTPSEAA